MIDLGVPLITLHKVNILFFVLLIIVFTVWLILHEIYPQYCLATFIRASSPALAIIFVLNGLNCKSRMLPLCPCIFGKFGSIRPIWIAKISFSPNTKSNVKKHSCIKKLEKSFMWNFKTDIALFEMVWNLTFFHI